MFKETKHRGENNSRAMGYLEQSMAHKDSSLYSNQDGSYLTWEINFNL